MLKRGILVLFAFVLLISIFVSGVLAVDLDGDGIDDDTGLAVEETDIGEDIDEDGDDIGDDLEDEFDDEDDGEFDDEELEGEEERDVLEEVSEEFADAELERGAGITPDSAFYFVEDSILSKFRGDLENREKKIAEIREMVEQGNIDAARESLRRYSTYADEFEREVDPARRDEARRSAAAIRRTLVDIESDIPEGEREDFVDGILEKEGKIVTAVEIASKIKELCRTLSELDPVGYSRVCNIGDDAPKWQVKLHSQLTGEQEKEAKAFFNVLSQCMRTSGRECNCGDISVSAFADKCAVVAPLAVKCEEGSEDACELMDEETEGMEDLLPDYLKEIFYQLEEGFEDEQFDNFAPPECRREGANTKDACFKIMFKIHAPPECVDALERGEIDTSTERTARESCEEIMFSENAPEECIAAGLRDHRECGKLMFRENAPQECIEAGLTGDSRSDEKKCREIMDSLGGPGKGQGPPGFAPALGARCNGISEPQERLKCFDEAFSGAMQYREEFHSGPGPGFPPQCREAGATTREACEKIMDQHFEQRFGETKEAERRCANECSAKGGAWDFSGGTCRCRVEEFREFGEYNNERPPYDCSRLDCLNGQVCSPYRGCLSPEERERELEEEKDYNSPPSYGEEGYEDNTARYDCSKLNCGPPPNYCDPWQGCLSGGDGFNPDGSSCDEGYEWDGSRCIPFGTGDYGFNEPAPGPTPGPTSEGGVTGGVIQVDNDFFNYYFK